MDVDVGTMNGVQLSPVKQQLVETTKGEATVVDEEDMNLESKFSIDDEDNDDAAAGSTANTQLDSENEQTEGNVEDNTDTLQDAPAPTVVVDDSTTLESALAGDEVGIESLRQTSHHATTTSGSNQNTASPNPPTDKSKLGDNSTTTATSLFDNRLLSFNPSSSSSNNTMTTFESLYHLSPSMAWRLRSAYAPITPQEEHFMSVGSEILTQRHPDKADGIMRGLAVARQCESRVCDGLRKLGELISYCERIKGSSSRNFLSTNTMDNSNGADDDDEEEDVNDEDIEAAEAMFAYFCEKNVLPMLIDSLLCHPPALSASDTILNAVSLNSICVESSSLSQPPPSSPFSGVNWTASVKSQILQTIAMILFNTSSPLSLTYLLSNNYMNELIMGMLPLDRWRVDALEELLPPYVTLLRGLVMRLRGDEGRYCLPLLLCQRQRRNTLAKSNDNSNENTAEVDTTETYLPLLYAAVQVFCSSFGTSLRDSEGCLIRTTAMNVILNLARISDPEMRMVLVVGGGDAMDGSVLPTTKSTPTTTPAAAGALSLLMSSPMTLEQELLFPHICNSLK
jgi:hypothetical protein